MPDPWPRLSIDLTGPRDTEVCQSCGVDGDMTRWQEHDDQDRPEMIVVMLCRGCAYLLIELHPRLYRRLAAYEPIPGAERICRDCAHRERNTCTSPLATFNGGPGMPMTIPKPDRIHVYAPPRGSGWKTLYRGPAKDCAGKVVATR